MPNIAIEGRDLEKTFKGGVRALDGVSFEVAEGTIFGMLGPNGAGKTTAVRILTTILRPDAGQASVLGRDVMKEPARVRSLIGLAGLTCPRLRVHQLRESGLFVGPFLGEMLR